MGRNNVPKLGEWRDGKRYYFEAINCWLPGQARVEPDSGSLICYKIDINDSKNGVTNVLATCFADGFEECLAAFFQAGFDKGVKEGRREKLQEIKQVLKDDE